MTKQKQNQMQENKTLEAVQKMLEIVHELPESQSPCIASALNYMHELLHQMEDYLKIKTLIKNN